jgi:hypothetical protein
MDFIGTFPKWQKRSRIMTHEKVYCRNNVARVSLISFLFFFFFFSPYSGIFWERKLKKKKGGKKRKGYIIAAKKGEVQPLWHICL